MNRKKVFKILFILSLAHLVLVLGLAVYALRWQKPQYKNSQSPLVVDYIRNLWGDNVKKDIEKLKQIILSRDDEKFESELAKTLSHWGPKREIVEFQHIKHLIDVRERKKARETPGTSPKLSR